MEEFKQVRLLGEGSFGKCYLVEKQSDGSLYVLKQINIRKMNEPERREAIIEANIQKQFDHPNITKCYDTYTTTNGKLCIIMEYADGGDLAAKIKAQNKRHFPESQIIAWIVQLCLALKHIHDRKILHRDIKAQNVFLTSDNIVKLGDFGIAKVLQSTTDNARTMVGTPYYLSPEIVDNKPYSFKSDVWSLGVLLYEICALKPPFDASSIHFLALKIVRGAYQPLPPHYSRDLKQLIAQMLSTNANKRPSITQILRLPFIKSQIADFLSATLQSRELSASMIPPPSAQGQRPLTREAAARKKQMDQRPANTGSIGSSKKKSTNKKKKEEAKRASISEEDKIREREEAKRKRDQDRQKMKDDLRRRKQQMIQGGQKEEVKVEWIGQPNERDRERLLAEMEGVMSGDIEEEEVESEYTPNSAIDFNEREDIIEEESEASTSASFFEESKLGEDLLQIIRDDEGGASNFHKVERLREYLEQRLGGELVLRIYNAIKEMQHQNEDWVYDDIFNRLPGMDSRLLIEYVPLVHSLIVMEDITSEDPV